MSAEASSTTSPTIQKKDDSSSSSTPVAAAQQQQQPLLNNKQFLKQLEKSWKPFPPWCVSSKRVPEDLNEELSLFSNLIAPTSVEMKQLTQLQDTIQKAIISGTSTTSTTVSTSGCTAAGLGLIEGPLFFSVDTTSNTNDSSEASAKIVAALLETKLFDESVAPVVKDESKRMKSGYSIRLREAQSNSQTSRNVILYFGEAATRSRKMGALLKSGFESTNAQACIAAWHVLMSSLKQTRNLDDTEPTALSSDAAATMMLSVANSYDTAPTCSQALTDFFLLYGFATSFDMSSKSVTIKGALVDVPKVHNTEAMSVIDPLLTEYDGYRGGGGAAHDFDVETLTAEKDSESVTNLAAGMTTASVNRLVNIFAYCYRVIAEYSRGRAEQERGRAESTLSTFLGGGPFWTRVVVLSEQGCDPYPEIVQHGLTAASNNNNSSASAGGGNKAVRNNNNNNNGKNNNYYNNNNNNNYNNGRGGRGYSRGGRGGGGRGNNNNNGYHHQNSTFVPHHHHHHQFAMPTPHHQSMMMNTNNSTFQPHHHQHHQQQFLSQQDMILLPTPNSRTSPPAAVLPANANNNAASGFQQPQQNRQQW